MTVDPQALLDDGAYLDRSGGPHRSAARALPWPQPPSAGDTVWFGAIDRFGNAVSAIQSTYFEFGSGLVLPRQRHRLAEPRARVSALAEDGWNALRPRRKPFHTLNPALARFEDGRTLAYGTMGGEGQPQTQAADLQPPRRCSARTCRRRRHRAPLAAGPHLGRGEHQR